MSVHRDPSAAQVVSELALRYWEAERMAVTNDAYLADRLAYRKNEAEKASLKYHAEAAALSGMLVYMTNDERWSTEYTRHEEELRRKLRPGHGPVTAVS